MREDSGLSLLGYFGKRFTISQHQDLEGPAYSIRARLPVVNSMTGLREELDKLSKEMPVLMAAREEIDMCKYNNKELKEELEKYKFAYETLLERLELKGEIK